MARESKSKLKERTAEIIRRLKQEYPDAETALNFGSPLELLIATILSAQCTDARVNMTTKTLFKKYRTVQDYAAADPVVFQEEIKATGFFRNKTKSVIGTTKMLIEKFGGKVPETMEELLELPGVARKTANVVLGNAFHKNVGVTVDTHVKRLSTRLGLTANTDAGKIEQDLMKLVPQEDWNDFSHMLIYHGRRVCVARKPRHDLCVVRDICPSRNI